MKTFDRVGVSELRKNLGRYLRQAKRGRTIVVTLRGESVAILIAAASHPDLLVANELCRKGIGSWKGGKPKGASRPVVIKGKPLHKLSSKSADDSYGSGVARTRRSECRHDLHRCLEPRRARSAQSRRKLGNRTRRAISMIPNIRKQLSAFVGQFVKVSLQGIVLVVKAIKVGFY